MDLDDIIPGSKMRAITDDELSEVSGGVLTDEQKQDCWEKIRRLKMFMRKEEFIEKWPAGEQRDYMCEIWADVPGLIPGMAVEDWQTEPPK